jgi:acyl carrier protein
MQTTQEILTIIQDIFHDTFDFSKETITLDADLREDLGLDSIDAIDLIILLEKKSGCKLTMEDLISISTVGDVIKKVQELLAQKK